MEDEENGDGYYTFMKIMLVHAINSACSLNYGKIIYNESEIWSLQRGKKILIFWNEWTILINDRLTP